MQFSSSFALGKTVLFSGQIMSADKYLSIFSYVDISSLLLFSVDFSGQKTGSIIFKCNQEM